MSKIKFLIILIPLFFLSCNKYTFTNKNQTTKDILNGFWDIIKIGDGQCSQCAYIVFFPNQKGAIYRGKWGQDEDVSQEFIWIVINSDNIKVKIISKDERGTLMRSGLYKVVYKERKFEGKTYLELQLQQDTDSWTILTLLRKI